MPPNLWSRVLGLAAALVTGALMAGCGGGDDGQLTKSEFLAKGDEVCKQAHEQFLAAQRTPPNTAQGTADLQRNLIDISENELADIRGLGAPDEVQPALDRYLQAREEGIALLKQGLAAAEHKDAQAYSAAMAKLAAGQVHRLKLAQAVGFTQCSRPSPQPSSS